MLRRARCPTLLVSHIYGVTRSRGVWTTCRQWFSSHFCRSQLIVIRNIYHTTPYATMKVMYINTNTKIVTSLFATVMVAVSIFGGFAGTAQAAQQAQGGYGGGGVKFVTVCRSTGYWGSWFLPFIKLSVPSFVAESWVSQGKGQYPVNGQCPKRVR